MISRSRWGVAAWCFFDWANSAFPAVIITFVFARYFTGSVAPDPITGTALWGQALGWSALIVAVAGPIAGAIADHTGRRKPWLLVSTGLCVVLSWALWSAEPADADIFQVLLLVALANVAFELGMVFYNAMLPDIVDRERVGRVSGWAWGSGYAGGVICLLLILILFIQVDTPPFGLDKETAEHVRIVGPFVAIWFAVFAIPMFMLTPDKPPTGVPLMTAISRGLGELISTLRRVREHKNIFKFLFARMFYTDGLNTLFAFGGIYAGDTIGLSDAEVIQFAIGINITAGIGAATFAWLDDRWGPLRVIFISLAALTVLGTAILVVEDVMWFWVIGLSLGLFVGPAQSASRSMMARLAPEDIRTEMFGLYALSGKATAFLGPMLVGGLTLYADSQRVGMSAIIGFFVVGGLLLMTVRRT